MRLEKLYILFISLLFVACIKDDVDIVSVGEPIEVHIRGVHGDVTRTALDGIGSGAAGSSQSIRWVEDDQIMVWAKEQGASGYTLDGQTFWLRTYNTTYGDADFVSNLSTRMEEDKTYNYYALYPKPASVTTDPQKPSSKYVSYTIPATQSGKYDSSLDVMVAQSSGRGLAARGDYPNNIGSTLEPSLNFSPLFHLIRIQIPEGANGLGHPVKKLEITFPQNVVGQISFDVTNPSSTIAWSGESNKITVVLDDNNLVDAGSGYIWLHVKPTQINGYVTIAAYSSSGVKSTDKTFRMERNMQARHITPISFSVPHPYRPVVNINLRQIANHLGEDWQKMTLTGLNFVGAAADGSLTITPSNTQIAIYPDVNSDYDPDMSSVNGKDITVTYESEHALLTGKKITLPENLQRTTEYSSPVNTTNFEVPYLFEEDFSDVNGHSHFQSTNHGGGLDVTEAVWMTDTDCGETSLSGWSGAKWYTKKGSYLVTGLYVGSNWRDSGDSRSGRVDTYSLPLKSNTKVAVSYKVKGWDSGGTDTSGDSRSVCVFGITTDTGNPIDANKSFKNPASPDQILVDTNGSEKYNLQNTNEEPSEYYSRTHIIDNCRPATRLTWCCHAYLNGSVTTRQFYMAIDDIKVSIGNEVK